MIRKQRIHFPCLLSCDYYPIHWFQKHFHLFLNKVDFSHPFYVCGNLADLNLFDSMNFRILHCFSLRNRLKWIFGFMVFVYSFDFIHWEFSLDWNNILFNLFLDFQTFFGHTWSSYFSLIELTKCYHLLQCRSSVLLQISVCLNNSKLWVL